MKADLLLKEIIKNYPNDNVVAIAQDKDENSVFVYFNQIPVINDSDERWCNFPIKYLAFDFSKIIKWDSHNWKQRIVTINDLK